MAEIMPTHHEDEGDVCRVCRVEGDEVDPLIHPCKCSGSVRYVHPDCLKLWLAQTGKKHCEICGYKYHFTKIYPEQLPSTIPPSVYIRQAILWVYRQQLWLARCCLVVVTWLIFLPSMNMFSLNSLLWLSDLVRPSTPTKTTQTNLNETLTNLTTTVINGATAVMSSSSSNGTVSMQVNVTSKSQPSGQVTAEDASITLWEYVGMSAQKWLRGDENSAVTYVLRGQILSISLAAVLIGLILLREWITQHNWQEHTRPQIVEEGEINPDEWIVMNGIARKTSEVVAAFLRADRGDRTDRVGPARGGGMWATPAPAPAPDDERDRRRTFVELAAEQREVRIQRTQGTLKAAKAALDNAQMRIGESANEEGLSELIKQVQMLQDKHDRLSADVREIFTGVRTPEIGSSGSDLPLPATDEELANEASSITKALAEYRAAHRRAEQRRADIGTSTSFDGQTDNDSSGDWNPPPPLTHNRGWLDRISSHVADESVNEEIRFDGEAEAGPSRPRLERVGTGLEGMESAPMDTKSESKRGQRENEGVAYTAPEMLKNKGKGKAADSDEDGVEAGSSRTAVNEGDIPLFLPSSPAPTASPASSTRSTAFSDQPVDIREDVPMLDHTHPEADKPRLAFDGLQDLLNDVPVKDGEVEDDEGEWEDEPEEERTEHGHVEQHAHEGEDEAAIDPIFRALEAANIQNGQQIVFGVGDIDENGRININPGPARRPVEVDFVNPEELDEEPWDRDDWNGILEVIGLIGPLSGLLQNVIFGIIIMGASISIFIGIPTFIGKLALSIDPIRSTLSVISRTLYLIRKVTDPIIDVVIEIVKEVVVLPFLSSVGAAEKIVARNLGLDSIGSSANLFSKLSTLLSSASTAAPTSSSSEVASSTYVGLLGDGLAWVGQHAYDFYSTYLEAKHSVASSRSVTGRIWCAAAGYSVVGAAVAVVALVGESGGGMSREVAKTIKEHSMFFKLAFFMLLELGAFPLGIGMMMDACTVPLWPGATLVGRLDRLRAAPFGVMFVDWLIGTMFMYQFATLLSHIRTLCRPGTLFFIRDPADPNYSPVKDIVEKSALSQLRKLSTSAIMYSVIVFTLFGGASWTLAYLPYINPFPLRIDPSFGPLTSIPFDLLFLHLAVPPTIELIRPLYRLRKLLVFWWKHTISLYQLDTLISSRRPPKEYNPSARLEKVWPILDPIYQVLLGKYDNKSTKARVPASDQVILLPPAQRKLEGGVFIALSDSGTPLNPEDKLRLLKQDKRAREAGRDPKADYQVITLPIYWRTRIHTFIASTLLMGAFVIAAGALGPVVVGRMALYGVGKERGVHDGYAWLAGAYVLYFSLSLGLSARRTIVTLNKAARSRRSGLSARIKRTLRRYLASIYGVVMVYGVTPVFVGVIAELYSSPFKGRKGMMILHFWDAWAMGTVICSLAVGLATSMARFRPARASFLDSVKERFHHPAPRDFATTNRVVVPALGYLAIPLLAPFFVAFVTVIASGGRYEPVVYHGMLQAIIPLLLRIFGAGILRNYFMNGWSSMRQTMIDAEYVVEERVENYEPGKEKEQEKGKGKEGENEDAASAGADGGLGIDDDGVGDNAEAAEGEEAEAEDDEWVDEDDGEDADDADETENPDEGE